MNKYLQQILILFVFLLTSLQAAFADTALTVLAVGDILIHQPLRDQALASKNRFHSLWSGISSQLSAANITYGNMEGPSSDSLARQTRAFSFNFPEILARDLLSVGFDIVSTANNHSLDRGEIGVKKTIQTLQDAGLSFVGTRLNPQSSEGYYKVLESKGVRTAWIACTDVKNTGPSQLVADCSNYYTFLGNLIGRMKTEFKADLVFVTPHWGEEKMRSPSSRQQSLAKYFFESGADVVIGAHPHVLQKASYYKITDNLGQTKNRLVYYSLGNFVSNQLYFGTAQKTSALAYTYFNKNNGLYEVSSYRAVPITMERDPYRVEIIKNKSSDGYRHVASVGLSLE